MHARATELIAALGLEPHPEGGYYRQIFRSDSTVQLVDGRLSRRALTTIYFLLTADDVSRWHRVRSDEVWHHYEGAALELLTTDNHFERVRHAVLGPYGVELQPVHVVAAGEWQAARSLGAYTLVGCTVGPGFEFADFQLLRDLPAETARLQRTHPDVASFV